MQEIWKDIEGYEGLYQVSNFGRIITVEKNRIDCIGRKSFISSKILKPSVDSSGYKQIILTKNKKRKSYKVHRLVGQMFIPNPNNYPIINHKDENKQNNNVENLEWCTILYNNQYGTRGYRCTRHLLKKIKQIDIKTNKVIKTYNSLKEAEKETNIKYQLISSCCREKSHSTGGYIWKYC